MTISASSPHSGEVEVTGPATARGRGHRRRAGRSTTRDARSTRSARCSAPARLANDASLREVDGEWLIQGDPTEAAFLVAAKLGPRPTARRALRPGRRGAVHLRAQADEHPGGRRGARRRIGVATKGAPDVLLARCTHEQVGARCVPLTAGRRTAILAAVDRLADQACAPWRRLPAAPRRRPGPGRRRVARARPDPTLGMVGIIDPPRPEAAARSPRRTGRHPGHDDHRRPPPHRGPHRRRPGIVEPARRPSPAPSSTGWTTTSSARRAGGVGLRRVAPSTSCASSTRSRPTATSSR
jgi:P-type Ca2+ transporter type 2C